jgi:hypothetical protein
MRLLALAGLASSAWVEDAATVIDLGKLQLHLCAPDIVRVTYTASLEPHSHTPPRVASAVVRAWPTPVAYTRAERSGAVSIATSALTVVVDLTSDDLDVAFFDAAGATPLLREAGRELNATADFGGRAAVRTRQRWAFADAGENDEALFGGGSQQQGA